MASDNAVRNLEKSQKLIVLHIGDPIKYNHGLYDTFASQFTVIRPPLEELQRPAFIAALKDRKWGDFSAIFRPYWNTGGEMGKWDEELIPLLPKSVRIFASAGAGYDWADTELLAKHGIVYCNGAAASSEAVADAALFHIISVFRNMAWSQLAARSLNAERWLDAHRNVAATAFNPRGRVLGIIGLGNIGLLIAGKARAGLGMNIAYYDIFRKSAAQEQALGATYYDNLDDLLGNADCVVVATPFSGTKLLDRERLAKFKRGSRLVNIARGSLVDEDALVEALKSGQLCAAGLDVFAQEPHVHEELIKMENVTLTCHTAGASLDTHIGFERLAMENIQGYLLEGKAKTPVNLHLIQMNKMLEIKQVQEPSCSL